MDPLALLISCVEKLGGRDVSPSGPLTVDFSLDDIPAFASVQPGGRLRGSVFISDSDEPVVFEEAEEWRQRQFTASSCRLDVAFTGEVVEGVEQVLIRVLFERPLNPSAISDNDPLLEEAVALFDSWWGNDDLEPDKTACGVPFMPDDPTRIGPVNAWLLMGAEASFFTTGDLTPARADALCGIFESDWTAAKQTEPGDLLFYYFTEPYKAIHFVARAVDYAYFEDIGETGESWQGKQWWCHTTPPVQIEPITLTQLQSVIGKTVMTGRSGRFMHPSHANELAALVRPLHARDAGDLIRVLRPVVGQADKPDPASMDLTAWRELAAGSLALEAHVERYLVEPLLRLALCDDPDVSTRKAFSIGPKVVDYAVIRGEDPTCVIEVKLRVRRPKSGAWADCADFMQAAGYGQALERNAILMDAFTIHLIPPGADNPSWNLDRHRLTDTDLAVIRDHLLGRSAPTLP
ncbi:hypothetical protein [Raineyella fluvialis]|uniref:Uncharacterized protein n=1 Tax=Raineyella fluvialis TaxID=2662261 RepID=A0A5Q2FEV0_9ACTN|nr:hypothetical protein [Raineyella fluvialis]QGF22816.1 hypothetical protein Rai3103_03050 [Raineyella fluvialis]